jgi:hypothetical protein
VAIARLSMRSRYVRDTRIGQVGVRPCEKSVSTTPYEWKVPEQRQLPERRLRVRPRLVISSLSGAAITIMRPMHRRMSPQRPARLQTAAPIIGPGKAPVRVRPAILFVDDIIRAFPTPVELPTLTYVKAESVFSLFHATANRNWRCDKETLSDATGCYTAVIVGASVRAPT